MTRTGLSSDWRDAPRLVRTQLHLREAQSVKHPRMERVPPDAVRSLDDVTTVEVGVAAVFVPPGTVPQLRARRRSVPRVVVLVRGTEVLSDGTSHPITFRQQTSQQFNFIVHAALHDSFK